MKKWKLLSLTWLFTTPWTVACQGPLSMGFSRQEYWSGLLFPFPGDLPDPEIEPRSPALQADSLPSKPPGKPHYPCEHSSNCSLPRSSVHGIFQARVLEWVAMSFSRGSSWPRDWTWVFCIVGRRFTVWATREVHEKIFVIFWQLKWPNNNIVTITSFMEKTVT